MLRITIPSAELWDERKQEFINIKGCTLSLEHSLVSISKWESKWETPFISKKSLNLEETIDYIQCMTLTQNVDPMVYTLLNDEHIEAVRRYIDAPMTATTFSDVDNAKPNREIITSEIIYYWMIAFNIPVEFQKWHINRLLTLIKVCNIKNQPKKKMSRREIMSRNAALNASRKKKLNTKG